MALPRETARLLCLIGYRGSGKTTVAELLSKRVGWPWIDADIELERRAGRTIKEIFATGGEDSFRDWESRTVADLTRSERMILALGGGVILRKENRTAIRRGLVIWLQADPETIWRRMCADATTSQRRPNLIGGGLAEVEQMLAARAPLYQECADYTVETADRPAEQVANEIVCLLRDSFWPGQSL